MDRTVLLTGASGGIGSVTAQELLRQGAHVIAHYANDRTDAEAACADAPQERWTAIQADLLPARRRPAAVARRACSGASRIDTVVVNAATMPETPLDGSDEQWDDGWERTMRVNVLSPRASCARPSTTSSSAAGER